MYKNLKKAKKGSGLEIHHIIEKRFAKVLNNVDTDDMLSIGLTHNQHSPFTKEWRRQLPYGKTHSIDEIWKSAQNIYAKYPELIDVAKKR